MTSQEKFEKVKIEFTKDEKQLIQSLDSSICFEDYSDNNLIYIQEKVEECLVFAFDKNYKITEEGKLCEEILDKLTRD